MKKILTKMFSVTLVLLMVLCLVPPVEAQASSRTVNLSNNKWYTNNSSSRQTVYHRIKVSKPGYITLSGNGIGVWSPKTSLRYNLTNNKKKNLTNIKFLPDSPSNYTGRKAFTDHFAVKKGTYYIKVTDSRYRLKYKFTASKDQSGASKAKAKNIGRGKTAKGLLIAGEKGGKSDWFKFTLPRAQKIKLTFNSRANDWVQYKLVPANSRISITGASSHTWAKKLSGTTRSVFPAGTYYIQVTRMSKDKNTSGYYTVSWK